MLDPETLWLNLTNIALGVVTLVCLLVFGREIVRELWGLVRQRAAVAVSRDAHELVLSDLGVTMADGGVEIDERSIIRRPDDENADDEPNIARSEN